MCLYAVCSADRMFVVQLEFAESGHPSEVISHEREPPVTFLGLHRSSGFIQ